jgi:hypothetical protein
MSDFDDLFQDGPSQILPGVAEVSGLWRATVRRWLTTENGKVNAEYHRKHKWCYDRVGERSQNTLENLLNGEEGWAFGHPTEAPDWNGWSLGFTHYFCFYFRTRALAEAFYEEFKGPDGLTEAEQAALDWLRANPDKDTMDYLRDRQEGDIFWCSDQCQVLIDRGLLRHSAGLCKYEVVT